MPVTYRGISQFEIAQTLLRLAEQLEQLAVGPLTNAVVTCLRAPDGVARSIQLADNKHTIAAAFEMKPADCDFTIGVYLAQIFDLLLPTVFKNAVQLDDKIELTNVIGSIAAWNGFDSTGKSADVRQECLHYCETTYGVTIEQLTFFPHNVFRGAFDAYQVLATLPPKKLAAAITDFAQANDLQDELHGIFPNGSGIVATDNFAHQMLKAIPEIKAFIHNGYMVERETASSAITPIRRSKPPAP